ncbi:Zinc finger TRAF-type-containing protein 1 [Saguinus oedipus]|uniref:Zinc finger TRAF-type-containing protein 1 n=1 Tax=Saguinus oedipus TaxID=9490 RepID=A0ABQ9UE10_SAGOE|nr:Zinc finger TRAF-type-containing protein 1 [Saguinus oedipus]
MATGRLCTQLLSGHDPGLPALFVSVGKPLKGPRTAWDLRELGVRLHWQEPMATQPLEAATKVTQCKYKRIGCPWHGPFHELTVHEAACAHPTKTGNELMEILDEMDQSHRKEMQLYNSIFSLLSFEKIGYTEVQFRPYRTDDFITRLYYETPRFTVLNQTWVLKARVNDSERNPNLSCKRTLSFQLLLKSKVTAPLECSFLLLKGPYDDVRISPVIYHFVFTNESNETDYVPLPIIDSVECNKLLAAKNINLRLFLFQIQK